MKQTNLNRRLKQGGFTVIEVLASISVLTIMVSVFTTLSIRINRLAKETQQEQTTIHELANLLELELERHSNQVSELSANSNLSAPVPNKKLADHLINEIPLNSVLNPLWPNGRLFVHWNEDGIGTKVTLTFVKNTAQPDALPISLSGWVIPSQSPMETDSQGSEPANPGDAS